MFIFAEGNTRRIVGRKSLRGCDGWFTEKLEGGSRMFLTSSPVLGVYSLPSLPTVGAVFKDAAFRECGDAETICTVHVTQCWEACI